MPGNFGRVFLTLEYIVTNFIFGSHRVLQTQKSNCNVKRKLKSKQTSQGRRRVGDIENLVFNVVGT